MSTVLAVSMLLPWVGAAALAPFDGRRRPVGAVAAGVLSLTLIAVGLMATSVLADGPVETVPGDWAGGVGIVLRADALGVLFALVSLLVMLAALAHELLAGIPERHFPALVLFMAAGLNGVFLTGDVFNFYVFFELSMIAGYVLASYRAVEREAAPSLIFAVVNLLGSFVFLIGIAALYHLTGSLEMGAVRERMANVDPTAVMVAVTFFVAFGVKVGLFPFHFWLPPVYAGAHPAAAAILSGALANIGGYGLLRFGGGLLERQLRLAATVLIALGVASILYGALQAVSRRDPGEVLAYSAVGQAGYILVALGVGGPVGYSAAVIYALVNALNKGLLFLASGLRGWPVAAAFVIGAFSVVGIPPASGFLAKVAVFRSGVEADSVALVALLFLGGALSFVYMLQLYQHRFWSRPDRGPASPAAVRGLVAGFALLVLALGVWPEPLVGGGDRAAEAVATSGP